MTVENLEIKVKATGVTAAANRLVSLADAMDRVQGAASSISGSAGTQAAKSVEKVGKAAEKANKGLGNFLASLKRIAFYRIIRGIVKSITQAFTEGLEKAYLFSQSITTDGHRFSESLDRMKSASNSMKGQLGSAFIGLLSAIEPVLIAIINLVTKAADAISQFFAAFTGKTYIKATATAAKFADTMARGGAAAKEWKNQLLGFDEINRLNEPSSGGGGGGGSNPLDGYAFEDTPINEKILNFVNTIKERLEPALDRLKGAFERLKEAWDRFVGSFSHGDLSRLIADLLALCGETIINGLTILADTLTLVMDVLTALNTGDWGKVWVSLKWLVYDVVVAVSDLAVGIATLLYDAIIIVAQAIDDLLGTHFADWMRDDRDAFLEMYNAEKQSEDGLFGLKKTLGLTKDETDKVKESTDKYTTALDGASLKAGEYTTALQGVGSESENADSKVRGIRSAVDWVIDGFRGFGNEVASIFYSLTAPIADFCAWIDSAIEGLSIFKGLGGRINRIQADGSIYLQGFASGGFPQDGQLFLANEGSAPEMVGTMGGRTAVATNGDIVEGIRQGVYEAVSAANNGGNRDVQVRVYLDSREIKSGQQRLNRAWGV